LNKQQYEILTTSLKSKAQWYTVHNTRREYFSN